MEIRTARTLAPVETAVAVEMLGALAQEARLEIFRLLVKAGPGGLAAGAVAAELGMAPATLSFHLKELRTAGIVICQKRGRSRIYSPDFESMKQLVGFLTEDCCRGLAA